MKITKEEFADWLNWSRAKPQPYRPNFARQSILERLLTEREEMISRYSRLLEASKGFIEDFAMVGDQASWTWHKTKNSRDKLREAIKTVEE